MSSVAFYAPMKAPTHPVPSGDRRMARNLTRMLGSGPRAVPVTLASELQVHDSRGDRNRQAALCTAAAQEVNRVLADPASRNWSLWVTYHCYYKAPDLLGPEVSAALGIPYVIIEASRARKRLSGPWAGFARAAEAACDAAQALFYMTEQDRFALNRDRPAAQRLAHLRPFLTGPAPHAASPERDGPLLSVAMMRGRDKLQSYALLAEALGGVQSPGWRLDLVGDGPARPEVEAMMQPFGHRVRFLGQLSGDALAEVYRAASVFVWPGVNEAYGMVYLEAQAAGVPVVAQDRPGVRDVLAPGTYPAPELGAAGLAHKIDGYLADPALRATDGRAAARHVSEHHLMDRAAETFWHTVDPLMRQTAS